MIIRVVIAAVLFQIILANIAISLLEFNGTRSDTFPENGGTVYMKVLTSAGGYFQRRNGQLSVFHRCKCEKDLISGFVMVRWNATCNGEEIIGE